MFLVELITSSFLDVISKQARWNAAFLLGYQSALLVKKLTSFMHGTVTILTRAVYLRENKLGLLWSLLT